MDSTLPAPFQAQDPAQEERKYEGKRRGQAYNASPKS